ncbi:hypothetical protein JCM9279_002032 [Rhodotorula babjevae]
MQEFDYADLITDDLLGFNPSPVFQPPVQPVQQPGYAIPTRGARGGGPRGARGGRGSPFPPRGGGSAPSSGRATPTAPAPYPTRGGGFGGGGRGGRGGLGSGFGAQDRGGFGGRGGMRGGGRGGAAYSGSSTPRHVVGMSAGAFNPLLVPVKFVKAAGDGLGTVGGEDEHGLELAGAASPPPPAREKRLPRHSVEGALADEVGNLDLDGDSAADDLAPPPPETAFEPEPATTATMALDELEDAPDSAEPAAHPGLGSRARKPVERAPPRAPAVVAQAAVSDDGVDDDGPPLFEISTTASAVTVDLPASMAPPAAFAAHDPSTPLSSDASDSDSEQILFPRRAQAHADPVSSARAPPTTVPRPAADLSLLASTSTPAPALPAARARTTHPSQPAQPAKQSKKALKRASRAARKTGRAHPRSGNAHLAGHGPGRTLADSDDDSDDEEAGALKEERAQDCEDGAALFARMQGGGAGDVDDMLVADSDDDEPEQVDAQGHVPGQPRQGDSDIEWGSSSPPPVGPAGARGRAKKAAQRAQRADQRERDKLERLVAAGQTRDEVELALALEVSAHEAEDERRRAARERERRRAEDDYLANVDLGDDEGDDSMAVLAAFATGAVGQLGGGHERGDDADRRMAEAEEDEDEWGTSSEGKSSSASEEDEDEDTEGAQDRRLAQEEEDDSEELDSDDELEMDYSLGDADGRVEHSLSINSSDDDSSIDSSLSSSTDSDAELYAFESALLAGQKISMQRMGQAGSGGRKDERERKKARARARKGKGKAHVVDSSSSDSDSGGDEVMFTGNDSWADRDEDYISQVQAAVRLNADLLSTAQGGRAARRSNRRERNKLFTAISQGNFDDIDLYDEAADLDEDLVEAMFAEQEEAGFGGPSKKQRKQDKTFNGAFSQQLAAQWDLDRSKKASKKAKRAAERAAAREADFRDTYRDKAGSYSRGKAGAKSLARSGDDDNDAATINTRMRHFIVTDISSTSMSLPPMAKKARIAVHLLAEVYGLKSRSMGSGKNRFPVLERTSKTTVVGVSEWRVRAIVGTADGEHELDGMDGDWAGPRGKGKYRGKVGGLWKALEGATGKKSGGGGRRDQLGKNSEGAVVGQGADKIGEDNVGFALLKKMGWTVGGQIGLSGQGLHEPVVARVKTGKSGLGLGGGFAVSRDEAWALARGPE